MSGFEPDANTLRGFTPPVASRAARIASGTIRHFAPRGRRRRYIA
jgi:hypothetical protein